MQTDAKVPRYYKQNRVLKEKREKDDMKKWKKDEKISKDRQLLLELLY